MVFERQCPGHKISCTVVYGITFNSTFVIHSTGHTKQSGSVFGRWLQMPVHLEEYRYIPVEESWASFLQPANNHKYNSGRFDTQNYTAVRPEWRHRFSYGHEYGSVVF